MKEKMKRQLSYDDIIDKKDKSAIASQNSEIKDKQRLYIVDLIIKLLLNTINNNVSIIIIDTPYCNATIFILETLRKSYILWETFIRRGYYIVAINNGEYNKYDDNFKTYDEVINNRYSAIVCCTYEHTLTDYLTSDQEDELTLNRETIKVKPTIGLIWMDTSSNLFHRKENDKTIYSTMDVLIDRMKLNKINITKECYLALTYSLRKNCNHNFENHENEFCRKIEKLITNCNIELYLKFSSATYNKNCRFAVGKISYFNRNSFTRINDKDIIPKLDF